MFFDHVFLEEYARANGRVQWDVVRAVIVAAMNLVCLGKCDIPSTYRFRRDLRQ